jgi:hypothetical protein
MLGLDVPEGLLAIADAVIEQVVCG